MEKEKEHWKTDPALCMGALTAEIYRTERWESYQINKPGALIHKELMDTEAQN